MHARDIVHAFLLAAALFSAVPAHAEDPRPWESPGSGIDSGAAGTAGKPEKIETIINTTGGTRSDGNQVSSSGTTEQQGFVNGFLNDAATKIKEAGGGSGWAWTWEKKWKIGPDGKPHEVKETWVEGNIGIESKSQTPAEAPAPTSAPAPAPAAAPSASTAPSGTAGTSAAAPSSTPSTPSKPSSSSSSSSAATPAALPKPAPSTAPKGIDAAPAKIAEPPVILTIFDPISQQECRYAAAINPSKPGRVPVVASITRPIYEDTRVKIALDLGPGIDGNDLSVTIRDNEGDHVFDRGSFPANYRHIFRVPNQKDYSARVVYKHPVSKESQEIISVQIPVLKLSFANRTVETSGARTDDPDLTGRAGSSGAGEPSQTSATGWGASTGSARRDVSAGGESQTYDMSDLYSDPANPPEVAGAQTGSTGSAAGSEGAGGRGADGASNAVSEGAGNSSPAFSSGRGSDAVPDGRRPGTQAGDIARAETGGESAGTAGTMPSGSGGSSAPGSTGDSSQGRDSGSVSAGTEAGQRQAISGGSADTDAPATSDAAAQGNNSYAMSRDAIEAGDVPTAPTAGEQGTKSIDGVATASVEQKAKPYLISVSIQNRATNAAQSFDINTDPAPTAQSISPQTPLAISVDFAQNVLRDSVKIEIYDGRDRITTSPVEMKSGVVEHIFENQTANAYVWVYGRTEQAPFSYKIMIPVTGL